LHPYAPQLVAVAADLEQLAKVELSIQLCMKLQRVMGARLDHLENHAGIEINPTMLPNTYDLRVRPIVGLLF
jgi:hypothetical protein